MSGAIWGTPLITCSLDDPIANLNNWTKQDMPQDLPIDYTSNDRTNRFTYERTSGHNGRMYYKFDLKPNTDYMFSIHMENKVSTSIDELDAATNMITDFGDLNPGVVGPLYFSHSGHIKSGSVDHMYECTAVTIWTDENDINNIYKLHASGDPNHGWYVNYINEDDEYSGSLSYSFTYNGKTVYYYVHNARWPSDIERTIKPEIKVHNPDIGAIAWLMIYGNDQYPVLMVTRDIVPNDKTFDELKQAFLDETSFDGVLSNIIVNYCDNDTLINAEQRSVHGVPFFSGNGGSQYVYLYFDYTNAGEGSVTPHVIKNIRCKKHDPGVCYLTGPIFANGEGPGVFNIIAAYPGAWIYPFIDKNTNKHHIFALSGDPFKLISVNTSYDYGYASTSYRNSDPMVVQGRQYHGVHMVMSDIESVDIISHLVDAEHTDEKIYETLSTYVKSGDLYHFNDVLDYDRLHLWLGDNVSDIPSVFTLTSSELDTIIKASKL